MKSGKAGEVVTGGADDRGAQALRQVTINPSTTQSVRIRVISGCLWRCQARNVPAWHVCFDDDTPVGGDVADDARHAI
jgi:hypothetical protein